MIDIDELEREQLENIVELIQGPLSMRSIPKNSRYQDAEDLEGDRILESLILWVDCIISAIEDATCPNEKLDIF